MERVFVKPAPGLLVRKPIGGHLAAGGEFVTRDSYWIRRESDGDVVVDETKKEDTAAPDSGRKSVKS